MGNKLAMRRNGTGKEKRSGEGRENRGGKRKRRGKYARNATGYMNEATVNTAVIC